MAVIEEAWKMFKSAKRKMSAAGFERKFLGLAAAGLLSLGSLAVHAADPVKGGQIYSTYCVACHGQTGVSMMPGAPNFATQERMLQPDAVLLANIKAGRNAMPAFQGIVSDSDLMNVIAFLRTLAR